MKEGLYWHPQHFCFLTAVFNHIYVKLSTNKFCTFWTNISGGAILSWEHTRCSLCTGTCCL